MSDRLAVLQTEESIKEIKKLRAELPGLIADVRDLSGAVNNFNRNLRSQNIQRYADGMQNAANMARQFAQIQSQVSAQMERLSRVEANNARAAAENARARAESARATREESQARQQAAREAANLARQQREESSAYKRLKKDVQEATLRARDYGAEIMELKRRKRAGTITSEEYRRKMKELSKDFSNSTKEALRLQKELERLNRATSAHQQKQGALVGRITDIVKALGITNLIDNVASSFYRYGQKAVETSMKLDTLHLSQKAVFKTSDDVNKQNEFLTKTANRYGIEILGLSEAYTKFAASAQGTYLEGQRTQTIFDAVSRSSAMLGVSSDETNGILRALGQMMSKGKVQAEELRGQLGDRMAGAFKLFADGMGVSTAELDKMLKKGTVLADDVLPKFAEQLNKKYKLDIDAQIDTQAASVARRENSWVAFIDGLDSKFGTITKSVVGFSDALSNMLEALTPSKQVTIIEQEQAQLNILGIQLQENWRDEKKRKDILDQMVKINPFFLEGLDKESLFLEQIQVQLKKVNDQYIQKIALEKQQEKIKELVEDQAQAYIYLNKVFTDNAVAYNGFSIRVKETLNDFKNGTIGYWEASKRIKSSTKSFSAEQTTAIDMLQKMNSVIAQSSLNFDGFNRGIDGNKIAIRNATAEYNNLVNMFEKMAGAQGKLVFMNGMTAKSFNAMGQEQKNLYKETAELLKKAELEGEKYALVRNVWRAQNAKGGWYTTKMKGEDYYLEDHKLKKREKAVIPPDEEKAKADSLSAAEKNAVMRLEASRDEQLAINEAKYLKGIINEKKYLYELERINIAFFNAKIAALKGGNAKETKEVAKAELEKIKFQKETGKKIFDIEVKQLDERFKIRQEKIDSYAKTIEDADYFSNAERLNKQIQFDEDRIEETNKYYERKIALAVKNNQDVLEWERKRDEDIGKIEDSRLEKRKSLFEAHRADLEKQTEYLSIAESLSYEQQKSLILSNKKLSNTEREFRLNLLEIDNQIKLNDLKIKELETLKEQYKVKLSLSTAFGGIVNPGDLKSLNELDGQIQNLKNTNADLNNQAKDAVSERVQATRDALQAGFRTLGLDHFADAYTATMERLKNATGSWKDYANLAVAAVLDSLGRVSDAQKEKTIENLNEQLKNSEKTYEQEQGFIAGRLEALNSLSELTQEQQDERNRLESEARAMKEQQLMREKMIEAQKARAEQRADSEKALMNGALGATQSIAQYGFTPAGLIAAGLALGFGITQSIAISSKNPVPQYWVGRQGGKAEWADTQERGREIIADENDNIVSLGSDNGSQRTWLNKGDKVYTAEQTKNILRNYREMPKIGQKIFHNIALSSLRAPDVNMVINNKTPDYSKAIAKEVGREVSRQLERFDKPAQIRENGVIYKYVGSNVGTVTGYYDIQTGSEISKEQYLKNKNGSN